MAVAPAKVVLASLVVRAREEVVEWRFEYRFDFERIERQVEWRCHPTDDRGDAETGRDFVVGKSAQHRYVFARETDFLLGLAQCRFLAAGIPSLNAAARKTDLARVVGKVRRTLREKDVDGARARNQRDQHRRFDYTRLFGEGDDVQIVSFRRPGGTRQTLGYHVLR